MQRLLAVCAGALFLSGCSKAHEQIQCPTAETGRMDGTMRETSGEIEAAGQRLAHGSENEIAEVASGVRSRHPQASKSEVITYLITAYCPIVNAKAGLAKATKQQTVQDFAKRAEQIVR